VTSEANEDPAAEDEETEYWLSQPHILQTIAEGDANFVAGRTLGEEEIRNGFGVPPWQG
jgi:hypothetical protein